MWNTFYLFTTAQTGTKKMHSMSKDGQYGHSCQDLTVSPQEASPCACFGCRAEEEFKRFSGATFNFLNHEYSVSQVDKSSMPRHEEARSVMAPGD
ncbi:hypothetical protein M514_00617 [Trichuris suis]|uniref:Uncharacterized protein n=1 Tax=Trichuris suis TaxID=68888 RepID=A0A085MQ53_9BILA|nr:hypothetical protein M514_00617 [Trichuris suis]